MLLPLGTMRVLGVLSAGFLAALMVVGGIATSAPWSIVGGLMAASACVIIGRGDRWDPHRDPLLRLLWQWSASAVLIIGGLLLAAVG